MKNYQNVPTEVGFLELNLAQPRTTIAKDAALAERTPCLGGRRKQFRAYTKLRETLVTIKTASN